MSTFGHNRTVFLPSAQTTHSRKTFLQTLRRGRPRHPTRRGRLHAQKKVRIPRGRYLVVMDGAPYHSKKWALTPLGQGFESRLGRSRPGPREGRQNPEKGDIPGAGTHHAEEAAAIRVARGPPGWWGTGKSPRVAMLWSAVHNYNITYR